MGKASLYIFEKDFTDSGSLEFGLLGIGDPYQPFNAEGSYRLCHFPVESSYVHSSLYIENTGDGSELDDKITTIQTV
jgi:hypothetical protein